MMDMDSARLEQTLVIIKPDALKNSLTGYVLSQLSEFHTGLCFAGAKIVHVSRPLAEEHYIEHRQKAFFPSLLDYLMGRIHYADDPRKRRVIALIYQGSNAAQKIRAYAGPTNPHTARQEQPGCIRALGTVVPIVDAQGQVIGQRMENLLHTSADESEAEREIQLWFKPNDIPPLMRAYATGVSDAHYYLKDQRLSTDYVPGGTCLLAPGDVAWQTDLEALQCLSQGKPAARSLSSIAAKYLINEQQDSG
jgi:nucleoside-diphosphate kinase